MSSFGDSFRELRIEPQQPSVAASDLRTVLASVAGNTAAQSGILLQQAMERIGAVLAEGTGNVLRGDVALLASLGCSAEDEPVKRAAEKLQAALN